MAAKVRVCIYVDKVGLANVIKLKTRGKTFVILSTRALSRLCSDVKLQEDLPLILQLRTAIDLTKMFTTSCLCSIFASQNNIFRGNSLSWNYQSRTSN